MPETIGACAKEAAPLLTSDPMEQSHPTRPWLMTAKSSRIFSKMLLFRGSGFGQMNPIITNVGARGILTYSCQVQIKVLKCSFQLESLDLTGKAK